MHGYKNHKHENYPIRPKIRKETTNRTCIDLSFWFFFSVDYNKQKVLANNN